MIKILGDRVLVLLPDSEPELVTDSGIILTKDPDYRKVPTRGIVAQLGDKPWTCELGEVLAALTAWECSDGYDFEVRKAVLQLKPAPFDVAVGDCVLFSPGDGEEVELDGATYVILREAEILAVVNPIEHEAA